MPALLWTLSAASVAAVVHFSEGKMNSAGARPAAAAALCAVAPLYAAVRTALDALHTFKAASSWAKVARVLEIAVAAFVVTVHAATVVRFAVSPLSDGRLVNLFAILAVLAALLATLAHLLRTGIARATDRVRKALYIPLGNMSGAMLGLYILNAFVVLDPNHSFFGTPEKLE